MARIPRLILPDVIYQVRAEAARNEKIFEDDLYKIQFLKILETKLKTHFFQCYAYSLENNHYHLALRTGSITISKFLQKINSTFARYYNKKKRTRGAVFSRPFTSIVIEEKTYLKDLVRYIHLNPIRNKSCSIEKLDNYQWCGHSNLCKESSNTFQNTLHILSAFTSDNPHSSYNNFIRNGFSNNDPLILQIRKANSGKQKFADPCHQVAGSKEFTEWAISENRSRKMRIPRYQSEKVTLENIHTTIENFLHLRSGELFHQGRKNLRSTARELFAYVARYQFDYSGVSIAEYLKKTDSAVSRMLSRFELNDKKVNMVEQIEELICKNAVPI